MIRYPDPKNPGASVELNNGSASRVWPDGRRECLSESEEARWYRKLREDNRDAERRARR